MNQLTVNQHGIEFFIDSGCRKHSCHYNFTSQLWVHYGQARPNFAHTAQQATFPLPESQLDRFLMRISMGYPEHDFELEIIKQGHLHYDHIEADGTKKSIYYNELSVAISIGMLLAALQVQQT